MIHDLKSVEMLAVDVEHHHKHSYLGFVCLLQLYAGKISTHLHVLFVSLAITHTPFTNYIRPLLQPRHEAVA